MIPPDKRGNIQLYERLTTLTLEEGFDLIRQGRAAHALAKATSTKPDDLISLAGGMVRIWSLRLVTFLKRGTFCSHEGCVYAGTYFAVERNPRPEKKSNKPVHQLSETYHINLWGVTEDGSPVLMTHDHIVARSLGGSDKLENTQTMCCWHNWEKGKLEGHQYNLLYADVIREKTRQNTQRQRLTVQNKKQAAENAAKRARNREITQAQQARAAARKANLTLQVAC